MGYLAVKATQEALAAARRLAEPSGGRETVAAARAHLPLAVDQVQSEAGLHEPHLAAIALTQARGDVTEAAFLLRGYRSTLPRRPPARAASADLRPLRRVSSAFRSVPGGQTLGATNDYAQRLLDLSQASRSDSERAQTADTTVGNGDGNADGGEERPPKVLDLLRGERLVAPAPPGPAPDPVDVTRVALRFPAARSARLQALARSQTGALVAFAYANLRGYGPFHPTLAEFRVGRLPLVIDHPRTGRGVEVGEITVSEAEALGQKPRQEGGTLGVGYGCVLGQVERKAVAMAVMDAVLSGIDDDVPFESPLADEEFVLAHIDGIEAAGFVEHLKLPHEVTFAADLDRVRSVRTRNEREEAS